MGQFSLPSGLETGMFPKKINFFSPLALAVLTAALAALLLPRQTPFAFSYSKGIPWSHATLKAPFDFEVLRPEILVKDELDKVEKEHGRYFLMDANVEVAQKRHFAKLLSEQARVSHSDVQYDDLRANEGAYLAYGQHLLDQAYRQGVIAPGDDLAQDDPAALIWLVHDGTEQRKPLHNLLTTQTALDFFSDSLPYSDLRQPEFLLPLLEKSIVPNARFSDSLTIVAKRRKLADVVSTGITVRRGEKIAAPGDIVTDDLLQKLDSLRQHYDVPKGPSVVLGYGLAALMAFLMFFLWLKAHKPDLWNQREQLLVLPAGFLLGLFLVSFGNRVGQAVPLIVPFFALPVLLWRLYDRETGLAAWVVWLFLTTFSLDWGMGWLCIQLMGGVLALTFFPKSNSLRARVVSAALVATGMLLAWSAAYLAKRLPDGVQSTDVPLFLLLSALLGLAVFPVGKLLKGYFEATSTQEAVASDLPVAIETAPDGFEKE